MAVVVTAPNRNTMTTTTKPQRPSQGFRARSGTEVASTSAMGVEMLQMPCTMNIHSVHHALMPSEGMNAGVSSPRFKLQVIRVEQRLGCAMPLQRLRRPCPAAQCLAIHVRFAAPIRESAIAPPPYMGASTIKAGKSFTRQVSQQELGHQRRHKNEPQCWPNSAVHLPRYFRCCILQHFRRTHPARFPLRSCRRPPPSARTLQRRDSDADKRLTFGSRRIL